MTPEQRAVRQFLSKPAPYSSACGCVGQQIIRYPQASGGGCAPGPNDREELYTFNITLGKEHRIETVVAIRKAFPGLSLVEAQEVLRTGFCSVELDNRYSFSKPDRDIITKLGGTIEMIHTQSQYEPVCGCAMKWVEIVDGSYFQIYEERGPEGVWHWAHNIGPIGGPYKLDPPEKPIQIHRAIGTGLDGPIYADIRLVAPIGRLAHALMNVAHKKAVEAEAQEIARIAERQREVEAMATAFVLPSAFQIDDKVRVGRHHGKIIAVIFTKDKVSYSVEFNIGVVKTFLSEEVKPAHLSLV